MIYGIFHGVWADDEEVWVSKELGVMLESKGYIVTDNRAAYVSAFVMMENPIAEENMCGMSCESEEKIDMFVTKSGCELGMGRKGVWGVESTVYKTKILNGSGIGRKNAIMCFKECMSEDKCKAFRVWEDGRTVSCDLRNRGLSVVGETIHDPRSLEFNMSCVDGGDRERFCEELMQSDKFNYRMSKENREFVEKHWEIVNRWVGQEKEEAERDRRRRSTAATALVGGMLGFLATGYGFYDTARLKAHVERMRGDYNEFKRRQVQINKDQIEFNNDILKVIKGVEANVDKRIGEVMCRVDSYAYHILNERRLQEWKDFLYHLYKDMVNGRWVGPVSTVVFTKENMKRIVETTNLLRGTIYEEDVGLAYRLGSMNVADKSMEEGKFTVHVVMRLPIIYRGGVKTIYTVHQTGVRGNSGCMSFKLPHTVYQDGGKYYSLDGMECEERDRVKICSSSVNATREEMPCLQDPDNCVAVSEKCETRLVQSHGGLLVRTEERVEAASVEEPDVFDVEKLPGNGVAFFNYSEFSDVLVGKYKVKGIKSPTISKVIEVRKLAEWRKVVRTADLTLSRQNLTNLSIIVKRQQDLMEGWNTEGVRAASWSWWGTPILASVMILGASYCLTRRCCSRSEITSFICTCCREREWLRREDNRDEVEYGRGSPMITKGNYEKVSETEWSKEDTDEDEWDEQSTITRGEDMHEAMQQLEEMMEVTMGEGDQEETGHYESMKNLQIIRGTNEEEQIGGNEAKKRRAQETQTEGLEITEDEGTPSQEEQNAESSQGNGAKVRRRKEKKDKVGEGSEIEMVERKRRSDIYTVQAAGLDPVAIVSDV